MIEDELLENRLFRVIHSLERFGYTVDGAMSKSKSRVTKFRAGLEAPAAHQLRHDLKVMEEYFGMVRRDMQAAIDFVATYKDPTQEYEETLAAAESA